MSMASTTDGASGQSARESNADGSAQSDKSLGAVEPTFVEWAPEVAGPRGQKTPLRLYHKKSRTGCVQCRARRVKVCPMSSVFSFPI
jgi:hypothetical protein